MFSKLWGSSDGGGLKGVGFVFYFRNAVTCLVLARRRRENDASSSSFHLCKHLINTGDKCNVCQGVLVLFLCMVSHMLGFRCFLEDK